MMKWLCSLLFLGCLLLLTLIFSQTKAVPTPEESSTFICEVSGQCEIGTPLLTIVKPIPKPKPMPDPKDDPKPMPLA